MTAEPVARRLRVRGRVQAVGYRAWAVRVAKELDLSGWVRNRLDGSVEALAVGPKEAVETFIALCRSGPASAHVEQVEVQEAIGIVASGFTQKPTV